MLIPESFSGTEPIEETTSGARSSCPEPGIASALRPSIFVSTTFSPARTRTPRATGRFFDRLGAGETFWDQHEWRILHIRWQGYAAVHRYGPRIRGRKRRHRTR